MGGPPPGQAVGAGAGHPAPPSSGKPYSSPTLAPQPQPAPRHPPRSQESRQAAASHRNTLACRVGGACGVLSAPSAAARGGAPSVPAPGSKASCPHDSPAPQPRTEQGLQAEQLGQGQAPHGLFHLINLAPCPHSMQTGRGPGPKSDWLGSGSFPASGDAKEKGGGGTPAAEGKGKGQRRFHAGLGPGQEVRPSLVARGIESRGRPALPATRSLLTAFWGCGGAWGDDETQPGEALGSPLPGVHPDTAQSLPSLRQAGPWEVSRSEHTGWNRPISPRTGRYPLLQRRAPGNHPDSFKDALGRPCRARGCSGRTGVLSDPNTARQLETRSGQGRASAHTCMHGTPTRVRTPALTRACTQSARSTLYTHAHTG